ncbi:MAG TPA: hypothetical protein VE033_08985 [Acetobacteraceae bacterium]|jgi:hypothetical protein|nr:hypothetical protein [Acetobacteraceae bacterium]
MHRRTLLPLLALPGCAALGIPAPPPTAVGPVRRTEPTAPKGRPRQTDWTTRFWEELSSAQRNRVLTRLRRQTPATTAQDAAARWDAMGLPEREGLLGGTGAVVVRR